MHSFPQPVTLKPFYIKPKRIQSLNRGLFSKLLEICRLCIPVELTFFSLATAYKAASTLLQIFILALIITRNVN